MTHPSPVEQVQAPAPMSVAEAAVLRMLLAAEYVREYGLMPVWAVEGFA